MVLLKKISSFFHRFSLEPSVWMAVAIAVPLLLLAALELISYRLGGIYNVAASRLWLFYMVVFFVFCYKIIIGCLIDDVKRKNFLPLILIAAAGAVIFWGLGNPEYRQANYEAAQQLGDGVAALRSEDMNYHSFAFIGYPVRQYAMLAIPSLLFGPSLWALQFPFDFCFFTGLLMFYAGLKRYFRGKSFNFCAVITAASIFASPFVVRYMFIREQTFIPLSFVLIAVGLYIILYIDYSVESIIAAGFCTAILGSMYTPGLSACALALYSLVYALASRIRKKRLKRKKDLPAIKFLNQSFIKLLPVNGIVLFAGATLLCTILKMAEGNQLTTQGLDLEFVKNTIKMILTENPYGVFTFFTPIALLFFFLAGLGFYGAYGAALALWSAACVIVSLVMKGYAPTSIVNVQRAMIIVPVDMAFIFIGFFNFVESWKLKKAFKYAATGIAAALVAASAWRNCTGGFNVAPNVDPHISAVNTYLSLEILDEIKEHPEFENASPALIYFPDYTLESNIWDYMKYFAPNLRVRVFLDEEFQMDMDESQGILIYSKDRSKIPEELVAKYGEPSSKVQKIGDIEYTFYEIAAVPSQSPHS
ncbi:MAG: hypothetical protein LBU32_31385 [Clostridiales bacterium]|jgi:hypothetical protein|nr:hypothetical protein [Clostridiales bacterium]